VRLLETILALCLVQASWHGLEAQIPELDIRSSDNLAGVAADLRAMTAEELQDLAAWALPRNQDNSPVVVLLVDEKSIAARSAPAWVSGYALPHRNLLVLFPQRVPAYPHGSLRALLRHELVHILLHRSTGQPDLPRWFEEGVATVAARPWSVADGGRLVLGSWRHPASSLRDLDQFFAGNPAQVRSAYALSAFAVQDLVRRQGQEVVPRILEEIEGGASFSQAFRQATGRSLKAFEDLIFRRQRFLYRWLPFLTSSGTLWLGITALVLLAVARKKQQNARKMELWDLEDQIRDSPSTDVN
jgi:hypothetical protein